MKKHAFLNQIDLNMKKSVQRLFRDKRVRLIIGLLISSFISVLFVFLRISYSGSGWFNFMIWNLLLAWIPFMFACGIALLKRSHAPFRRMLYLLLTFVWILFFPNTLYIITDLFHLDFRHGIPLWFDLVLLISFVWNGIMLGFISLRIVQDSVAWRFGRFVGWIFACVVLFISSFGIYIGRYQRFNSWDIFLNPLSLLADVGERVISPFQYPGLFGMTIAFSLFFVVGYLLFNLLLGWKKK